MNTMIIFYLLMLCAVALVIWLISFFIKKSNRATILQTGQPVDSINPSDKNIIIVKKSSNGLVWFFIVIVIVLGLTLPFHYIPSAFMVFPKNNLTFSYTFITQSDISDIINRYNSASIFQREAMNNEPIVRKLMEKGLIYEKK